MNILTRFLAAARARAEARDFLRACDVMFGFIDSSAAWGAVRAGVFDYLDANPGATARAAADSLGLREERLVKLLRLLEARGMVRARGGGWDNSAFASRYFTTRRVSPDRDILSYFSHWVKKMEQYGPRVAEVLRGELSSAHPWPPVDEAHSEYFERMMQSVSWVMAPLLSAFFDLGRYSRILDVGGGNGAIVARLAEAFPGVRFGLLNVPAGAAAARRHLESRGLAGKVDILEGDYRVAIPAYGDALLWIRNMHDYPVPVRKRLARNAYEALPDNGDLLVCEGMRNPDTLRGYAGYMYSVLGMDESTFYPYTFEEYRTLLLDAGFASVKHTPLPGGVFSVITARKK